MTDPRDEATALYHAIDKMARDYDHYEYGLPRHNEEVIKGIIDLVSAALDRARREQAEADAVTCEERWRNARNEPPRFEQNLIAHGCIASAAAIRAKLDAAKDETNQQADDLGHDDCEVCRLARERSHHE